MNFFFLLSAGKLIHYGFILLTQMRNVIINISYKNYTSTAFHFHKLAQIAFIRTVNCTGVPMMNHFPDPCLQINLCCFLLCLSLESSFSTKQTPIRTSTRSWSVKMCMTHFSASALPSSSTSNLATHSLLSIFRPLASEPSVGNANSISSRPYKSKSTGFD